MADNLPDEIERMLLDWLLTDAVVTRPTMPVKIRLLTANGTDAAAGTEVTGDNYTAGGQAITFGAAATATGVSSSQPGAAVTFTMIDSVTEKIITGAEMWDSAATPKRLLHGAFGTPVTVPAGEPLTFPLGSLKFQIG